MTETDHEITLRPVSEEDREFLLQAYEASREVELSLVPWDDVFKRQFVEHQFDAQTRHYKEHYPRGEHSIIELGGNAVGRLYVNRGSALLSIMDMAVLAAHRKQGIGGRVLDSLKSEADSTSIPVRVLVEDFNPALAWFTMRGFTVTEEDGFMRRLEYQKSA